MNKILYVIAAFLGIIRILIVTTSVFNHTPNLIFQIYKDIAHMFDFWLFGAGYIGKREELVKLAWGLALLELICFLIGLLK